jgi:hypothetical protein
LTEPNSLTTDPASEWPQCPCVNCRTRVAEAIDIKARANLLRQAVHDREPWGVLAWNAVELVEMLKKKGLA